MNSSAPHPHRRRLTRAEVRRRRRSRAIRRVAGLTVMLCVAAGGVSFLLTRHAAIPSASAASAISMPAQSIADSTVSSAENTAAPANALGLTADEARAMLADPLMVLVNHTSKMPDDYTFDTKECGSATAVNKTLQTVACDAFLSMQKAAAADDRQDNSGVEPLAQCQRNTGPEQQDQRQRVDELPQQQAKRGTLLGLPDRIGPITPQPRRSLGADQAGLLRSGQAQRLLRRNAPIGFPHDMRPPSRH